MTADRDRVVANVIGYESINSGKLHTNRLGVVLAPARAGGYFLAKSTAGADAYPGLSATGGFLGGALSAAGAAEMVRARWGYPSDRIGSDGKRYARF